MKSEHLFIIELLNKINKLENINKKYYKKIEELQSEVINLKYGKNNDKTTKEPEKDIVLDKLDEKDKLDWYKLGEKEKMEYIKGIIFNQLTQLELENKKKLENKKSDNSDNLTVSSFNSDISEESSSTDKLLKEIEKLKKTKDNSDNLTVSSFNSDISKESSSTDKLLKELEEIKNINFNKFI